MTILENLEKKIDENVLKEPVRHLYYAVISTLNRHFESDDVASSHNWVSNGFYRHAYFYGLIGLLVTNVHRIRICISGIHRAYWRSFLNSINCHEDYKLLKTSPLVYSFDIKDKNRIISTIFLVPSKFDDFRSLHCDIYFHFNACSFPLQTSRLYNLNAVVWFEGTLGGVLREADHDFELEIT